jgi:NADH:ubiquinone oxidoreductase subunit 5 (subunit L)/multisubunit Na+/H+ antiporter MnhA subunit
MAASGAASGTRPSGGFTFDPVSALGWAVPLLLIAPFATFLLALSSVRTRRSASATAMFGTLVTLLLTLLVAWGLSKKSPYVATYHYLNISVAFSGPTNFQTFAIDLALHVDHLTVAALLVVELCVFAVLGWHQIMGRSEPGAARFHALITVLLFAAVGILVSWDLAELFGFWMIGGALTYLLLAHRWGLQQPAAKARIALALPFLTDMCLLSGIGWLYARYGTQDLNALLPILHTNPGWTVRSLVVGSVLLFVGVGGRLALWPFSSWLTQTAVTAPPAAAAIAQSVWSVVGIVVLYRLTPIFVATNQRTLQTLLAACAVAAVVAAVLGLLGNEPRRAIVLVGSAVAAVAAAIVINGGYHGPAALGTAGVAAVFALAPARAGAMLAISTIANAMRTDDLVEMGDAWRRMRASSGALLAGVVVMGLSASAALANAVSTRSKLGLVLGEALLLVAVGGLRVYFSASFGPLRRRRAFDPDRVREPQGALGWPYWLAVGGVAFLVASFIPGWLGFLDGSKHPTPAAEALVLWVGVPVVGFAACAVAYVRGKDSALGASAFGGAWLARGTNVLFAAVDRFVVAPTTDIARRLGDWIPAGDGTLGRLATASGQLAIGAGRAPTVPLVVLLAIVLAVVFALIVPGVAR